MTRSDQLLAVRGERFDDHRPMLRALAFRLTGSIRESDAALRDVSGLLERSDRSRISDLRSWLIAATGRHCLATLRAREVFEWHVPDLVVSAGDEHDADGTELLGGATGVASFVALDDLSPEERVAFVLHDGCRLAYQHIGALLGQSASAAEGFARLGRERLRRAPESDVGLAYQRKVIRAYFKDAKRGDFDAVRGHLHPDVTLRSDAGPHAISAVERGDPETIARRAVMFTRMPSTWVPALVNGAAGAVIIAREQVIVAMGMTVVGDRVAELDILVDPKRLAMLDLPAFS